MGTLLCNVGMIATRMLDTLAPEVVSLWVMPSLKLRKRIDAWLRCKYVHESHEMEAMEESEECIIIDWGRFNILWTQDCGRYTVHWYTISTVESELQHVHYGSSIWELASRLTIATLATERSYTTGARSFKWHSRHWRLKQNEYRAFPASNGHCNSMTQIIVVVVVH